MSHKKATDKEVLDAYKKTGNIWKAGELLSMAGQTVHDRLVKLGANKKINILTESDTNFLRNNYTAFRDSGDLETLAKMMGRTKQFICRKAKELGLTDRKHKRDYIDREKISSRAKEYIKNNGHPKGFKGGKHTEEAKQKISKKSKEFADSITEEERSDICLKALKTKFERYNTTATSPRINPSWKQGHRTIGGKTHYYKSRWEANYARYLQFLKEHGEIIEWEYEKDCFWFEEIRRGTRSYLPDFKVTLKNDSIEYHEVKGWMDKRSKTKLKRMKKYHPEVVVKVIDSKWFKKNNSRIGKIIPAWEK